MKESFGELYARLHRENFEELEALRGKEKRSILGISAGFMISVIIAFVLFRVNPLFSLVIIFSMIALMWSTIGRKTSEKKEKTYSEVYKEKIVGPIIENVFEAAKYDPEAGISYSDYIKAGYNDHMDRYSSEDLIVAPLKTNGEVSTFITFADVLTERESTDKDGNTSYSTVFHGLAGSFLIPNNLEKKIYIRSNKRVSGWNKNKVKMDMPEFEKVFDVESDDSILTMRILTADVMAEMIDLYQKYKYKFEISIIKDTVYMRLSTGDMFEPQVFKGSMEYKSLEKYYLVLKALTGIAEHIYNTILKLEM